MDRETCRQLMHEQLQTVRDSELSTVFGWGVEEDDLDLFITLRPRRQPGKLFLDALPEPNAVFLIDMRFDYGWQASNMLLLGPTINAPGLDNYRRQANVANVVPASVVLAFPFSPDHVHGRSVTKGSPGGNFIPLHPA